MENTNEGQDSPIVHDDDAVTLAKAESNSALVGNNGAMLHTPIPAVNELDDSPLVEQKTDDSKDSNHKAESVQDLAESHSVEQSIPAASGPMSEGPGKGKSDDIKENVIHSDLQDAKNFTDHISETAEPAQYVTEDEVKVMIVY